MSIRAENNFLPWIRILIVRKTKKKLLIFFLDIKTQPHISHKTIRFFYQGLNQKPFLCREVFDVKMVDCVPCIRILIVRNFQRMPFIIFISGLKLLILRYYRLSNIHLGLYRKLRLLDEIPLTNH